MASLHRDPRFKLRALTSALLVCSMGLAASSVFALQEIADEDLGDSTGEGIAFLPENAFFTFRGAGANESLNTILTDRTNDTGYIRYIPVGPLTKDAQDTNKDNLVNGSDRAVGKADLFLYGLAVSKADGNSNSRLNATDPYIGFWGSPDNPWLFKVDTALNVPTFNPDTFSGSTRVPNTQTGSVTYLALEAPLRHAINRPSGNGTSGNPYTFVDTKPTTAAAGGDAYKLKLAFWADAFVRDPRVAENMALTGNQFGLGQFNGDPTDNSRANRMRLQAVWDNFSLNGSRIQLFQTLAGSTNTNGMSEFYNNTLGIAGVLRFNSGDGTNLKATAGTPVRSQTALTAWQDVHVGANAGANNTGASCNNGGPQTTAPNYGGGCQYQVQTRSMTQSASGVWVAPTTPNVLRFSTQQTTEYASAAERLTTPAIGGGTAPVFSASEGLFIYNLNTNLILGSLYQPLTIGSDGKNFSLELARIPNKESIYKQIYTDYTNTDASYKGSTCNYYQCGTSVRMGGTDYQGYNATHSSISIGTVTLGANNTLVADNTAFSVGISFGALPSTYTNPVANTQTFYDMQYKHRQQSGNLGNWCGGRNLFGTCTTTYGTYAWQYRDGSGVYQAYNQQAVPASCTGSFCSKPESAAYPTVANRTWTGSPAAWITVGGAGSTAVLDAGAQLYGGVTYTGIPGSNTISASPVASPLNNMGSAVIDGLLIQHLKITTKGL